MNLNTLPANLVNSDGNFVNHISNYIGTTVTIFTTSGGQSGYGFTGVLIAVTPTYVRLITQIGPAPGCALGSGCIQSNQAAGYGACGGNIYSNAVYKVGSVTDIPIDKIASFVHNAV